MSEESKKFSDSDVLSEVCEQSAYALHILGASRRELGLTKRRHIRRSKNTGGAND